MWLIARRDLVRQDTSASTEPGRRPSRQRGAVDDRHGPHPQQPPAHDHIPRRTNDGLSRRETIRGLKRYVAREIYNDIRAALTTTSPRIERDIAA